MRAPADEAELAEAVAGAEGPLAIVGGGTCGVAVAGEPLSVAGLSGITLYEPGALTMVARAGTPLAEIEAALEAEGQRLAFEPPDFRSLLGTDGEPTIGGVFATNASGPRRIAVGAARDFLLGVRFVDGTGTVVRNGGRVMKNVTGYDLTKLMAGSWGTLGVLTEVAFKVLPKPAASGLVTIQALSPERAVAAMAAALGSPFEVTGAAHLTETPGDVPGTMLRIEGSEASVAYRLERLAALMAPFGNVAKSNGADWARVRDLTFLEGGDADVWRLSVRPTTAAEVVARLPEGARVLLDWGGGLIWAAVPPGTDVRGAVGPLSGHARRVRGGGGGPRFPPEAAPVAALSAGLRAQFDPRGILNPGLMG
ncbi:FAD-binding protein [Wenxinia marina]|uniref:FAD/FMN-containing dehydrogenase n=1 Tax=Wenxinia marina DSM 24838 TaxID=1123501 RepID=A0A0D0QAG5_9RHOB|nr:FAD-binding protein [Wenxinia marina]KIQ67983.1 FAD/FMN-containing dehydrogenase [Wenxinia marina DSM 24838]GGL75645.1 2-hydroxy-acid oxidase [Wenxinia marina]